MTIRFLTRHSARRASVRHRGVAACGLLVFLALGLAGCVGAWAPEGGSYLNTIPEALKKSDLGIVQALAGPASNGLSGGVDVSLDLDHGELTVEELRQVISIIVPLIDRPGASYLTISFHDVSEGSRAESTRRLIDITIPRRELLAGWGAPNHYGDQRPFDFRVEISDARRYLGLD